MSDKIAIPVVLGLAIGIAFVSLFAIAFQSITPIPMTHIKAPLAFGGLLLAWRIVYSK